MDNNFVIPDLYCKDMLTELFETSSSVPVYDKHIKFNFSEMLSLYSLWKLIFHEENTTIVCFNENHKQHILWFISNTVNDINERLLRKFDDEIIHINYDSLFMFDRNWIRVTTIAKFDEYSCKSYPVPNNLITYETYNHPVPEHAKIALITDASKNQQKIRTIQCRCD